MSHLAIVNGTSYETTGGQVTVGGTGHELSKGRTYVSSTGYDVSFAEPFSVSFTGTHNFYGDMTKGWIEMLSNGTLTIEGVDSCDFYLLGAGYRGSSGDELAWTGTQTNISGGNGGRGGLYYEQYGVIDDGSYSVTIGSKNGANTVLGSYSSASGTSAGSGGSGGIYTIGVYAGNVRVAKTVSSPGSGGSGRQPFTGRSPMSQGFAAKALGAGGGGGSYYVTNSFGTGGSGGTYGGGEGDSGKGTANTGGGGGGSYCNAVNTTGSPYSPGGGTGGSGIAIVRWGY